MDVKHHVYFKLLASTYSSVPTFNANSSRSRAVVVDSVACDDAVKIVRSLHPNASAYCLSVVVDPHDVGTPETEERTVTESFFCVYLFIFKLLLITVI